jgi:hypothetical protein
VTGLDALLGRLEALACAPRPAGSQRVMVPADLVTRLSHDCRQLAGAWRLARDTVRLQGTRLARADALARAAEAFLAAHALPESAALDALDALGQAVAEYRKPL